MAPTFTQAYSLRAGGLKQAAVRHGSQIVVLAVIVKALPVRSLAAFLLGLAEIGVADRLQSRVIALGGPQAAAIRAQLRQPTGLYRLET
jgi:hypothetical protein